MSQANPWVTNLVCQSPAQSSLGARVICGMAVGGCLTKSILSVVPGWILQAGHCEPQIWPRFTLRQHRNLAHPVLISSILPRLSADFLDGLATSISIDRSSNTR